MNKIICLGENKIYIDKDGISIDDQDECLVRMTNEDMETLIKVYQEFNKER